MDPVRRPRGQMRIRVGRDAEASAGMYSIVVTAKANGLNPRKVSVKDIAS